MNPVQPIGLRGMRERFGLGPRRARKLLLSMRHLSDGKDLWTTEAWLAEWLAARAVPGLGPAWPDPERTREPVDADVIARALELVGALAERGAVRICSVQ